MAVLNETNVSIDTAVTELKLGEILISADRRSTKENKLSDAERIRRVVLPANSWGEASATLNGEKSQSLTDVLREAIKSIASDRLKDTLAENPMQRTVALSDYSIPALLKWSTETATSRGSITFTRDDAISWFKASNTATELKLKHGEKGEAVISFLANRYGALAAKNHGLKDESESLKLQTIIDERDLEPTNEKAALVVEIFGRLEAISKQLKAKAAESSISLDDI